MKNQILIIDDSADDIFTIKRHLKKANAIVFECLSAECAEEALKILSTTLPDCILLDYQLPDMTGLEFLEVLKTAIPSFPPVVFMTGHGTEEIAVEALKSGAIDYLPKTNLDAQLLIKTVTLALERHKAITIAKNRHDYLQTLFKVLPDPVFSTDASGCITQANNALEKILHTEIKDLLGVNAAQLFPQALTSIITNHQDEENFNTMCCIDLPGHTSQELEISTARYHDSNGQPAGSIVAIHDVTNFKRVIADLEKLITFRDKLLSIISHDLRNPLTGIAHVTESLVHNNLKLDSEQGLEVAKLLHRSATQSLELLESLLTWGLSQKGGMTSNIVKTNLEHCVLSCISLLNGNAQEKQLHFELSLDKDHYVLADPDMVQTILRNLMSNAIKFSNPKTAIHIASVTTDSLISLSIKDEGVGMSPSDMDRLFLLDRRFTKPGTADERGNGFGLILVKELLEKQQGTIRIESSLNQGCCVIIQLPIWKE